MAQHCKDLIAWQKAMSLVTEIYEVTQLFPKHEIFGLTSQLRRAAVSIPSNIAEGQSHYSKKEFLHFLRHSRGSVAELETQLLIAKQVKYLATPKAEELLAQADEVSKILSGLMASLER